MSPRFTLVPADFEEATRLLRAEARATRITERAVGDMDFAVVFRGKVGLAGEPPDERTRGLACIETVTAERVITCDLDADLWSFAQARQFLMHFFAKVEWSAAWDDETGDDLSFAIRERPIEIFTTDPEFVSDES